jgi:hypothetical protein
MYFYILFEVTHTSEVYKKFQLFHTFIWMYSFINFIFDLLIFECLLRYPLYPRACTAWVVSLCLWV